MVYIVLIAFLESAMRLVFQPVYIVKVKAIETGIILSILDAIKYFLCELETK